LIQPVVRHGISGFACGDADGAGNVCLACSGRCEDVNIGRVFPPVGCCDSFQLAHVDTALFCPGDFSQACIRVSELCLGDGLGDIALLALCVGFFDCGEEDVFW